MITRDCVCVCGGWDVVSAVQSMRANVAKTFWAFSCAMCSRSAGHEDGYITYSRYSVHVPVLLMYVDVLPLAVQYNTQVSTRSSRLELLGQSSAEDGFLSCCVYGAK
jgi:hypothetical protein